MALDIDDKAQVKVIIAGFTGEGVDDIHDTSSLEDDLEFDDLDRFELTMELEEHFNIDLDDDKFQEVKTVEGVYELLGEEIA